MTPREWAAKEAENPTLTAEQRRWFLDRLRPSDAKRRAVRALRQWEQTDDPARAEECMVRLRQAVKEMGDE